MKDNQSNFEKQTSKDFEIRNNKKKKQTYSQYILKTWKVGTPLPERKD